jgi:NodT family efflux transporter outer membrane factor (OMF) lipoprotein
MRNRRLAQLTCCLLLAGCSQLQEAPERQAVVEDALPDTTTVRAEWAAPAGDSGEVDDNWIASFNDDQLNALVTEAISTQNPQMRILSANVDRAEASTRLAASAKKPMVGVGAGLSGTGGNAAVEQNVASGGFGVSWEADVWGRIQAGVNAADETLRATEADFQAGRMSLAANVAKAWYLATELSLQVQLAEEVVGILKQTVSLVEKKQQVGQVAMQDVFLARGSLASANDALEAARGGQRQAQRALEILLGRYPAGEIETATELVPVPPPIPVGLPSELLERRPDLIAADRRVAAAFFVSEQARLATLPRFTLSAATGATSALSGAIGSLGAGAVAPLYTGGAIEAQIDIANADQQAAIGAYGLAVLNAFEEVEAALTNSDLLERREQFLAEAVDNNLQVYNLARKQYDVGQIELLNLLQIQAGWIGARVGLLDIKNQRLAERVNLHLALGGSFQEPEVEEPPAPTSP